MMPTDSPPDLLKLLPDFDNVRAAIAAADKRARLLRRLLRLAIQLEFHLTTADRLPTPARNEGVKP